MSSIGGWFTVEREIIDKAIFNDKSLLQLYIYLRSQAKFKPIEKLIDNKTVTLQPGQLTLGSRQLASVLVTSPTTAHRMLKKLEKMNEISIYPFKSCSLITLNYWPTETPKSETPSKPVISSDLCVFFTDNETQMKHKRNADETQMKPPIESNKDKKIKENIYSDFEKEFEEWWSKYPNKKGKGDAISKWVALRKNGTTVEQLTKALDNYIAEIKRKGTDKDYIKYGSTFLGKKKGWEDYVNVEPEPEPYKPPIDPDMQDLIEQARRDGFFDDR